MFLHFLLGVNTSRADVVICRGQEEARNVSIAAERRRKQPMMHQNYSACRDWIKEARDSEDEVGGPWTGVVEP
jgi:hypothetical protein